jgi:hypothetical protein
MTRHSGLEFSLSQIMFVTGKLRDRDGWMGVHMGVR